MTSNKNLPEQIIAGITKAREQVYKIGSPTPLEETHISSLPVPVWIKREDLGPIKAYKWRGAFNAISNLSETERANGVIAASAGNHAQGVALACSALKCHAKIFMPISTPQVKQNEVARFGGEWVQVILFGDRYDDASAQAQKVAEAEGASYIHPYNDLDVISGQGTLADEIIMSGKGAFDRVYIAIGGGGLASATSVWLKLYWPDIEVIGVEAEGQASMKLAFEKGEPTSLDELDVFCDGTAVKKVGNNTYDLCREFVDRIITVSNAEVCEAVRLLWESSRIIPEPSGAMSLAGIVKDHQGEHPLQEGEKPLSILCGANMDFAQIGNIAQKANLSFCNKMSVRISLEDTPGALVNLLSDLPKEVGIGDMQYGYAQKGTQYPLITFIGSNENLEKALRTLKSSYDVTILESMDSSVAYRLIEFSRELLQDPEFLEVEFPERAGALKEFMTQISPFCNLYYFNYQFSGERVGRALLGVDYISADSKVSCQNLINKLTPNVILKVKSVQTS